MRILVTGGLGFIGSNFVRYMYNKLELIVVDAYRYGANINNLKGIDCEIVEGDICDYNLMKKLISVVDVVINFAAETHVDRSIAYAYPFIKSNIVGVYTILDIIANWYKDVRFVQISTDEVYGEIAHGSSKENSPLKPSSPYAASKAAADMLVIAYTRTYGVDSVIVRCSNNYGSYQLPEKFIPKTIISAIKGRNIPVYGTGNNIRSWLYVEDNCEAIKLVMERGVQGEIYNVATNDEKTNLEVVHKILAILNKDKSLIKFVEDRPGHDMRYSLDYSKICELGWQPRYDFDEGIELTVKWYVENEWWWQPLIDERMLHPTPWKLDYKRDATRNSD